MPFFFEKQGLREAGGGVAISHFVGELQRLRAA